MRGKPLVLVKTESGCIVPTSHKLNEDGYFRYTIRNANNTGRVKLEMYHRYVWEQAHGKIPDGYEIDHKCKNRACCNIEHLQMLEGTEHAIQSNIERYADRMAQAYVYWKTTNCTGTYLGERFNVSFSTACRWIRNWKIEGVETIRKE